MTTLKCTHRWGNARSHAKNNKNLMGPQPNVTHNPPRPNAGKQMFHRCSIPMHEAVTLGIIRYAALYISDSSKCIVTLARAVCKAVFSAERLPFDFSGVAPSCKHGLHHTQVQDLCRDATVATIATLAHHASTPRVDTSPSEPMSNPAGANTRRVWVVWPTALACSSIP